MRLFELAMKSLIPSDVPCAMGKLKNYLYSNGIFTRANQLVEETRYRDREAHIIGLIGNAFDALTNECYSQILDDVKINTKGQKGKGGQVVEKDWWEADGRFPHRAKEEQ